LARLLAPTSGRVTLGGRDMAELPQAITGRRISYVGQAVSLMSASLRDNLLYGLKHRPLRVPEYDAEEAAARADDHKEARLSGNLDADLDADWIDYQAAGVDGPDALTERTLTVLNLVAMDQDIYQIGLRSAGSARPEEVEAALDYGSNLITDMELQEVGMAAVLERIPAGGTYYLTVDADGMDPTIAPAIAGPAPGGVTYPQMRTLIHGLVAKGRVAGMDIVEITPKRDVNAITCVTAVRLICNLIGKAVRAGYFD
jgi:agmatinase